MSLWVKPASGKPVRSSIVPRGFGLAGMGVSMKGCAGQKKQGATGITTVAPYIAGQWGRGE
jgi:hypothetical protein